MNALCLGQKSRALADSVARTLAVTRCDRRRSNGRVASIKWAPVPGNPCMAGPLYNVNGLVEAFDLIDATGLRSLGSFFEGYPKSKGLSGSAL